MTVSGVSSGGYMAVQFHVAHSATVRGAGVIAGGPYYCAQGTLWTATNNCMTPGSWSSLPPVARLVADTEEFAKKKQIDPTLGLLSSRAWLFTGTNDKTVYPEVVRALRDFYGAFKVKTVLVDDKPAGHAMVTESAGSSCAATAPPYINDCHFDAAGALLRHILGLLTAPVSKPEGRIVEFDQGEFAQGGADAVGLGDAGFAYVPKACEAVRCRVHVVFHGCRQQAGEIGDRFVREAGYNRWADSNRLIVLYPQTVAREGWSFRSWSFIWNPKGCWDWWGYTGAQYATRDGLQIRAVKAMLERLSAPR